MLPVFVYVRAMSEQYLSTTILCQEVGMSRCTLDKLRMKSVLLPGREFYRLNGMNSSIISV